MIIDFKLLAIYFLCLLPKFVSAEHCARFSNREDGDINYDPDEEIGLRLGSIATLQCHNGNIRRSRCTANGWKPSVFNRCQQVVRDEPNVLNSPTGQRSNSNGCSAITNLQNGFVVYSALGLGPFKADTTASLVCNLGFLPSGSSSARCDATGVWSELGTCESATVQQCLPISEIPNGQVSYISGPNGPFGLNSIAELSCKLGYSAVGNNRVTCGKTGWEKAPGIGHCVEKEIKRVKRQQWGIGAGTGQCPPLSVINGQVTYLQSVPSTPYSSGSTALLTCNPTYSPIGSTSSYCSGTIWSPSLGTCQQTGTLGTNPLGIGGVPTMGISGFSQGATCPALPQPLGNGQILYSMGGTIGPFPSGTTATLTCNPGFVVNSGLPSASCQNGAWNPPTIGQCTSSTLGNSIGGFGTGTCPAQPVPVNGQIQYSSGAGLGTYPEGASATLTCFANFQLSGSSTTSCRGAQWYPPLGTCVGQGQGLLGGLGTTSSVCALGLAAPIGGGTVQYSTGSTIGPWQQGTTATLICPAGSVSTSASSSCQFGQWSPPFFQPCGGSNGLGGLNNNGLGGLPGSTIGQCPVPLMVMGGTITYSNGNAIAPFPSGTVGTLQCQNGGTSLGPTSSSCQNGVWSPTNLGPCGPGTTNFLGSTNQNGQTCPFGLLTPANGQVTYSQNSISGPYPSGSSATLTCSPNFVAQGATSSYCQVQLDHISKRQNSDCFALAAPLNGQITYSQLPSLTATYPTSTTATLICNFGSSPQNGPSTSTCLSNGWSTPTLGTCSTIGK